MKNIKLTIAYKGSHYAGWQCQPNGDTIQQRIMDAIKALTGQEVTLHGAGRTDAGVHARGQVASFFMDVGIPIHKWPAALNTKLPNDIRIIHAEEVPMDFHPQYSAHTKTYCYRLYTGDCISPFYDDFAWKVPIGVDKKLDVNAMKAAAISFVGVHDFRGFMSTGSPVKTTIREIMDLSITEAKGLLDETQMIEIAVTGTGFLYNMVRIIAGTLVDVGMGKIQSEAMASIIASCDRNRAGITAPAKGLMLMAVGYQDSTA